MCFNKYLILTSNKVNLLLYLGPISSIPKTLSKSLRGGGRVRGGKELLGERSLGCISNPEWLLGDVMYHSTIF